MHIGLVGRLTDKAGNIVSMGAGKDTVADIIVDEYDGRKLALADPLKETARNWWDFSHEQLYGTSAKRNAPDLRYPLEDGTYLTPRKALQVLGTEVGRQIDPLVWIRIALRRGEHLAARGTIAVTPDVRFKNELRLFKESGVKLVLVHRCVDDIPQSVLEKANHPSETELNDVGLADPIWDAVIDNTGGTLEDLKVLVLRTVAGLK